MQLFSSEKFETAAQWFADEPSVATMSLYLSAAGYQKQFKKIIFLPEIISLSYHFLLGIEAMFEYF